MTWQCHLVTSPCQGVCSRQGNTRRGSGSEDTHTCWQQAQQADLCFDLPSVVSHEHQVSLQNKCRSLMTVACTAHPAMVGLWPSLSNPFHPPEVSWLP